MRHNFLLSILILALAARPAAAGIERAGTTGANFLSLGVGAGELGMGGATLGSFFDLSGVSWNAASLGLLNETQIAFSHAPLAGAGAQDWMGYGGRMGISRTRWAITGLYQGDGAFEGRDALGNSTGSFSASSMAFGATLAQSFGPSVVLGLGGKVVTEKLADASGFGGTFDAGLLVHKGPFGFGLAAQNLGGRMKYGDLYYSMPTNLGAGVSFASPATGLRLALDVNHPSAYYHDIRAGVEWMWRDRVAIRTGYRHELGGGTASDGLNGPTFGMGAGVRGLWFDYGYLASSNGDGQHRIALRLTPHAWGPGAMLGGLGSAAVAKPAPQMAEVMPPAPKNDSPSRRPEPVVTKTEAPAPKTEAPAAKSASSTSKIEAPAPKTEAPAQKIEAPAPKSAIPSTKSEAPSPKSVPPAPLRATTLAALAPAQPPAARPVTTGSAPLPAVALPAKVSKPVAAPVTDKPVAVAQTPAPTAGTSASLAVTKEPAPADSAPKPSPAIAKPAPAATAPASAPRPDKVRLKAGETLIQLARRYDTTVAALMMENDLVNDQVKVGQVIKIPNHK